MADVLAEARRLAASDDLLGARVLMAHNSWAGQPDALAFYQELLRLTAHADSRDAYADFYHQVCAERPFTPLEFLKDAHLRFPRWGHVREQLLGRRAHSVLELGCHDAWTLLNLAFSDPRIACLGVDLSPHMVAEVNRRAARYSLPVRAVEGFLEDVQLSQKFDAVLLLEVLEHVLDVDVACAAAERHLSPQGLVYVSFPLTAPVHSGERERREHLRLFDEEKAIALLTAPGRRLVWYVQFPVGGERHGAWHHCGAYRVVPK